MTDADFQALSDQINALHYGFGLLVRHLHVSRTIEVETLIRELHRVADQDDVPAAESLHLLADQLAGSLPAWNRDREVRDLYLPARDRGSGRN